MIASFYRCRPQWTAAGYLHRHHRSGATPRRSGTITANGQGGFDVTGTHAYHREGFHAITVHISDFGGSTVDAFALPPCPMQPSTPPGPRCG